MATLAYIAGVYTFLLFGLDAAAADSPDVGDRRRRVWIAVMTWICYLGIELSARTQYFLLAAEILILGALRVVALVKVYTGDHRHARSSSLSWFSPFAVPAGRPLWSTASCSASSSTGAGTPASASTRNPSDSANGPGKAAIMSTILLVLIYVTVATAAQAFAGTELPEHNPTTCSARWAAMSSARRSTSC